MKKFHYLNGNDDKVAKQGAKIIISDIHEQCSYTLQLAKLPSTPLLILQQGNRNSHLIQNALGPQVSTPNRT